MGSVEVPSAMGIGVSTLFLVMTELLVYGRLRGHGGGRRQEHQSVTGSGSSADQDNDVRQNKIDGCRK